MGITSMMALPSSFVFTPQRPRVLVALRGMEDDMRILDRLAVEVARYCDFDVRRKRRGLVLAAAVVIVLGAERERAEREANSGHENANGKMKSVEHAGILSRPKVWGETVRAARDKRTKKSPRQRAAWSGSADQDHFLCPFPANLTIGLARWARSRQIPHAERKSNQCESS